MRRNFARCKSRSLFFCGYKCALKKCPRSRRGAVLLSRTNAARKHSRIAMLETATTLKRIFMAHATGALR